MNEQASGPNIKVQFDKDTLKIEVTLPKGLVGVSSGESGEGESVSQIPRLYSDQAEAVQNAVNSATHLALLPYIAR